jgi:hypothetical protein
MASDLDYWSAADIAAAIRQKKISAVEVIEATLARAAVVQDARNPFVTICAEEAFAGARAADAAVARGDALGRLHGVPFHVKDLVNTKGVRTTFCSAIYEHNVPAADSVCVARLKQAGASSATCASRKARCSDARQTPGIPPAPAADHPAARAWHSPRVSRRSASAPTRAVRRASRRRAMASWA